VSYKGEANVKIGTRYSGGTVWWA